MPDTYSTKEASILSGASRNSIRSYTEKYARYLSTEATPERGKERRFTESDVRLFAFVYRHTQSGETYDQVLQRLAAGELESFNWRPPDPDQTGESGPEAPGGALVPIEHLRAATVAVQMLQEERNRLQQDNEKLLDEIRELRQALGRAEGELMAVRGRKRKPPRWWITLFGGE